MPKKWDVHQVPALVTKIYQKVLERDWDPPGLIVYGSQLDRGEESVRSIVRIIALSQEHTERFIRPNTVEDGVKICYRHILGREADPGGLSSYIEVFEQEGVDNVINALVDSEEYTNKFGEDSV